VLEDCEHRDHVEERTLEWQSSSIGYVVLDQGDPRASHIGQGHPIKAIALRELRVSKERRIRAAPDIKDSAGSRVAWNERIGLARALPSKESLEQAMTSRHSAVGDFHG